LKRQASIDAAGGRDQDGRPNIGSRVYVVGRLGLVLTGSVPSVSVGTRGSDLGEGRPGITFKRSIRAEVVTSRFDVVFVSLHVQQLDGFDTCRNDQIMIQRRTAKLN
jgi:hypothetical protein